MNLFLDKQINNPWTRSTYYDLFHIFCIECHYYIYIFNITSEVHKRQTRTNTNMKKKPPMKPIIIIIKKFKDFFYSANTLLSCGKLVKMARHNKNVLPCVKNSLFDKNNKQIIDK